MASVVRASLLRQTASLSARPLVAPSRAAPSLLVKNAALRPLASAFHTSSRKNIIPAGPQHIEGSVNDAQHVPPPSPSHGSYHWTFDRIIATGLIPLTLAPFAAGSLNPVMDAVLCGALLVHSHTGFQSMIIDYIPKWRFPGFHRAFMWVLNAATAIVGLALYEFETNDVGMTEAIKKVWKA